MTLTDCGLKSNIVQQGENLADVPIEEIDVDASGYLYVMAVRSTGLHVFVVRCIRCSLGRSNSRFVNMRAGARGLFFLASIDCDCCEERVRLHTSLGSWHAPITVCRWR